MRMLVIMSVLLSGGCAPGPSPRPDAAGGRGGLVGAGAGATAKESSFRPAWWCPGPHLQTVCGAFGRNPHVPMPRSRWELPDGDFLDVDETPGDPGAPVLIVLHGLEGSTCAALGLVQQARKLGWGALAVHFRSCSGELNRLRRSYHGGETGDLAWVIDRVAARDPSRPIVCAGLSLGGNVLLKYLGERGDRLPTQVLAAVAISAPVDLKQSAYALDHGFARVYGRRLVKSLKRKALAKLERFPDLADRQALIKVRTLKEFDDLVTAPVHGFKDAEAYWAASSANQFLPHIARPTLLINARNDPFFPPQYLPQPERVGNPWLTMDYPASGGHLGFVSGAWPWKPIMWADERAVEFLREQLRAAVVE